MRILLTGASGFVGSHIVSARKVRWQLTGIVRSSSAPEGIEAHLLDLTKSVELRSFYRALKPQVVIHTAALSRVLECESEPERAESINLHATQTLSSLCRENGAKLIFFSSDQVFDGTHGRYREADTATPINVYGRTKLLAEHAVLDGAQRNLVIRSNSIVGRNVGWGMSFTDIIHDSLSSAVPFRAFHDQFRSPIHISHMIKVVELCVSGDIQGVLHAGGARRMNRVELLSMIADVTKSELLLESVSYRSHPQCEIMPADTSYTLERVAELCPGIVNEPLIELLRVDYAADTER